MMEDSKTIRCKECGAVLVELYLVSVAPGSKVVTECTMRCRNKHCTTRKMADPHVYFDIVVEDKGQGVAFNQKKRRVVNQ